MTSPKFPLGHVVSTPGALHMVHPVQVMSALGQHASGDWGDVETEDLRANEDALLHGGRLMSVYQSVTGVVFWVITEADRSVTTVLLPEEY